MKTCSTCGEAKPLSKFHKANGYRGGYTGQCKPCRYLVIAAWREKNHEHVKGLIRNWNIVNIARRREIRRDWQKRHRPLRTPVEKLHDNMRTKLCRQLKETKNRAATVRLLGYSIGALRDHLEALFQPGMSWENYGEWHVDHIRPKASFNITSPDDPDFRLCWALSNLQPLWGVENCKKQDKWDRELEGARCS